MHGNPLTDHAFASGAEFLIVARPGFVDCGSLIALGCRLGGSFDVLVDQGKRPPGIEVRLYVFRWREADSGW